MYCCVWSDIYHIICIAYFSEWEVLLIFCACTKFRGTALQARRSRVRFPMVSLEFFIDTILPIALWPWVDSGSNRNKYQECFLGVNVAGAKGWQPYHLHVPTALKSWRLNLLEPSGFVQDCNGIALLLRNSTCIAPIVIYYLWPPNRKLNSNVIYYWSFADILQCAC